jgi:outer membrane lipoprotein-sorting protein
MRVSPRASAVVVVAVALAMIVGGVVAGNAQPTPPALAPLTAPQLLSKLITASEATTSPPSFSGEASSSVNLGLPQIPEGLGGASSSGLADLLMGDQTYKVWRSPDGLRIANLLRAGERDLVVNATDAWFWDSQTQTAKHLTYDGAVLQKRAAAEQQAVTPPDPATLATKIVRRLAPFADLSVTSNRWVAGEPTYTLVLTPTSSSTLVGSIEVALGANNWMPLQIQVFAKGVGSPAISVGFTSISFGSVDPSMFDFTPPAGATVTTTPVPTGGHHAESGDMSHQQPLMFGTGFDAVIAYRLTSSPPEDVAAFLPYAGPLASATVVDKGTGTWLLAGAVPVSVLHATAAQLP